MSDSKTFTGITQAIFECVKSKSHQAHGTNYVPPNANKGTATTKGEGWEVQLGFELDTSSGDLSYTLLHKTWIVPEKSVWSGISSTIDECRRANYVAKA